MVNILYYMEPIIEADYPYMKYINIVSQLQPHIIALKNSFNISLACADHIKSRLLNEKFPEINIYGIDHIKLNNNFPNAIEYNKKIRDDKLTESQKISLKKIITNEFPDNFSPEIIITFLSYSHFLKSLYPNAVFIHMEYGIFSRPPYPKTYHLDPFGILKESYTNNFKEENLPPLSYTDKLLVKNIRNLKERLPNLPETVTNKIKEFKSTILLPLQFSNYHAFDLCSHFPSQHTYLAKVLSDIPSNIGVLVTEHPGWQPVINKKNSGYLNEFKNLIYHKDFSSINNISQSVLPYVDGVVSVSSSIGLQSMLYDLPVYIYGESHLSFLSENNIGVFLEKVIKKTKVDRENVLAHLLKHYYIPEEFLQDPLFIKNYIYSILNKNKEMPLIETSDYLADFYSKKEFIR